MKKTLIALFVLSVLPTTAGAKRYLSEFRDVIDEKTKPN